MRCEAPIFRIIVAGIAWYGCASAQTSSLQVGPGADGAGSVSGIVREAGTGAPIANAEVSITVLQTSGAKKVATRTDATGAYALRKLPPNVYQVYAQAPGTRVATPRSMSYSAGHAAHRNVVVGPGQDVAHVDLRIDTADCTISGKVEDENREPLQGVAVVLIEREYEYGILRYHPGIRALTNDRGEYFLRGGIQPGRGYLLRAEQASRHLEPLSQVPKNPKLRKPVLAPAYYPNAPDPEGAEVIVLRPGEDRLGADIRIQKAPSVCLEATLLAGGAPARLDFEFYEEEISNSSLSNSTMPNGVSGTDGRIRLCDVPPGQYRLVAKSPGEVPDASRVYGSVSLTFGREDLRDVTVAADPGRPLLGEVTIDGDTPRNASTGGEVNILLQSLTSMERLRAKSSAPGRFSFVNVHSGEYRVLISGLPNGTYVKEMTYGGTSILRDPLRFGSALGNAELRVLLSRDGGALQATVADKDANAAADCFIYVMPGDAASEPALAASVIMGQSDQYGSYSSRILAPGKYYVLASESQVSKTPEGIHRLWTARTRATEVTLGPGASAGVRLTPVSLDP